VALVRLVIGFVLLAGGAWIAGSSAVYFGDDIAPFVIEKLPLPHEDVWMAVLKVHVVAAVFSLPACVFLQWSALLRRLPRLHRWLGRVTGIVVLCALVPSGSYLAFFAKGGVLGTLGFLLSGLITSVAMVRAVQTARARRFVAHRRWTLHVIAQLGVAVASRLLLPAFEAAALEPELAYLIALWLPVLGSILLVEQRRDHARPVPRPLIVGV
jgi:hypothetical protein